jgi:hypothetical protein
MKYIMSLLASSTLKVPEQCIFLLVLLHDIISTAFVFGSQVSKSWNIVYFGVLLSECYTMHILFALVRYSKSSFIRHCEWWQVHPSGVFFRRFHWDLHLPVFVIVSVF